MGSEWAVGTMRRVDTKRPGDSRPTGDLRELCEGLRIHAQGDLEQIHHFISLDRPAQGVRSIRVLQTWYVQLATTAGFCAK